MTQRSKTELDTFFADNTSGLITPARLREFVESCAPSTGGLHFDAPIATPIAAAETPVKAANVSTLHSGFRFSMPANNRLQYDGDANGVRAVVTASLAFTCADDAQVLAFGLYLNGALIEGSEIRTTIATGADIQAVTITAHPTLSTDDYLEVWVSNETSDADVTIDHGHMHAMAFLA